MSKPWYIVGGGPSLKGFDWDRLDGRRVIAVNRAFAVLPRAEIVYFTDGRIWEVYRANILDHRGKLVTGAAKKHVDHPRVENYRLTGLLGLDRTPGHLRHGNNSGHAALNLAYHLSARRIYLLGFDMIYTDGASHWHEGYPWLHRERVFDKMTPHFGAIAAELAAEGIHVWNANPDSNLAAFPFCSHEDALQDAGIVEAVSYSSASAM